MEHVCKIISRESLIRRSNTSKRKGLDAQEQSRKDSQKWKKFHKEQDQVKGTVLKHPKEIHFCLKINISRGLSRFLWTPVRHKGPFVPCETYRKGKYKNVSRGTSYAINYPTYHKERQVLNMYKRVIRTGFFIPQEISPLSERREIFIWRCMFMCTSF